MSKLSNKFDYYGGYQHKQMQQRLQLRGGAQPLPVCFM